MTKEYHKEYSEQHYKRYRDTYAESLIRRRKERLKWYRESKSTLKCAMCGESHPAVLDFHHLDPLEKDVTVAKAVHSAWGEERILKEMGKCVVLCSNCHRKTHWVDL